MSDTKDFSVVRIARSDGADTGPGYWPLPPKKPATATEKPSRTKPPMIRLTDDDPRFTEWRVKLGILLKQELAPTPDGTLFLYLPNIPIHHTDYNTDGNAWYVHFPRGYWLYEKSKHLWVSGYPTKAKLYKTPQEFAVHLIWLLSSSQDYKDCCCVHCNPTTKPETPVLPPSSPAKITPVPLPVQIPSKPRPPQWSLQSPLLFRSGELVWYQTGNTWRLGVIKNYTTTGYELIPMGYALVPQAIITKNNEDMRPYQAFSVPPVSVPDLTDKIFDEIPWETMFRSSSDSSQRDIILLDASKLAASKIDYSYSLWSPTSSEPKATTYYGCFLGAERIEIGDCLRVKNLPPDLNIQHEFPILGLRYIFTSVDFPGSVFFRGSLYIPASAANDPSTFVADEALPVALRDEVQWRNQSPGPRRGWILAKAEVVLKESSIRGRFYPMHRLMPIMNPAEFQAAAARGQDAPHPYLNSRMDGYGRYLGRKMNRLDALGAGVAQGSQVAVENHIREEGYA